MVEEDKTCVCQISLLCRHYISVDIHKRTPELLRF